MSVSLIKLLKKLSHKALVENTSNLLRYKRPIQNIYSQTVQPIERLNQTHIMTSPKLWRQPHQWQQHQRLLRQQWLQLQQVL